jgi:hypothetical protein
MLTERARVKKLEALTAHDSDALDVVRMKTQHHLIIMQKTQHCLRVKPLMCHVPKHFRPVVPHNPVVTTVT